MTEEAPSAARQFRQACQPPELVLPDQRISGLLAGAECSEHSFRLALGVRATGGKAYAANQAFFLCVQLLLRLLQYQLLPG